MRRSCALLVLTLCASWGAARAEAPSSGRCPVAIYQVELSYTHQGVPSKPQLKLWFGSATAKPISTVAFSLSLLDSGGYPHLYPDNPTYRDGLQAGQRKLFVWDLAPDSVDIHRTGEVVVLQEVKFKDATNWANDDTDNCLLKVDYHAR
jgi:hypothetical protein